MKEAAYDHAALALAAGLLAQIVAARLTIPSVVVLLAAGAIIGPDVLGWLDPAAFGDRGGLITLAVTVILFEGGLGLDVERLRQQRRSLLLLLTVGATISFAGGAIAAHALLGLSWSVALLYGALMIVTGPTVVTPLLARLRVDRRVRELLVAEGVLIDPIGVIVAIVVADSILEGQAALASGALVAARLAVGAAVGTAAGRAVAAVLRRRWLPDDLVNPAVLGSVLVAAALASHLSAEAGLMAAVIQGITLANARLRELRPLREFKEALSVILLSFLFVVLAADLRLVEVRALGWSGLAVAAALIWIARPLAVAVATFGSDLSLPQRAFVAWICPRGIVAAAGAGLFGILLREAGIPGGSELQALTFLTVAFTVGVQGLTAGRVSHFLGVDVPSPTGTVIVGADELGRTLGRLLAGFGRPVVLVDRSRPLCRLAREAGLPVLEADALSVDALEDAGTRYADTVIALTRNAELNALVAQRVRDNFLVERAVAIGDEPRGALPGDLGSIDEVNERLRHGRLRLLCYAVPDGFRETPRLDELTYGEGELALCLGRGAGARVASGEQTIAAGDRLWCLRPIGVDSPLGTMLQIEAELDPREAASFTAPPA